MPAAGRALPVITVQVSVLLSGRQLWLFVGIEAHRDHLELFPGIERHRPESAHEPGEHLRAEHRAFVIDGSEDNRFGPEIIANLHCSAGFVTKLETERTAAPKLLIDADVPDCRGQFVLGLPKARKGRKAPDA